MKSFLNSIRVMASAIFLVIFSVNSATAEITQGSAHDLQEREWPVDFTYGFPVWTAFHSIGESTGTIFLLIVSDDFKKENLNKVFTDLVRKNERLESLQMTVFSNRSMLKRAIHLFKNPIYIDFAPMPKGLAAKQKWEKENKPLPKGYYRAYYYRSPQEEYFKYSPDPDNEGYLTVTLRSKLPQPQSKSASGEAEANVNECLLSAVMSGDVESVKKYIASGADVNYVGESKQSSLAVAALYGHIRVVNVLIEHGADTDLPIGGYKETPLILASGEGRIKTIKALLSAGADINIKSADGRTALIEAAGNGHTEVVNILLRAGAAVNIKGPEGKTALMLAADDREVVEALLDKGAELEAKDDFGRTPLFYAVVMHQLNKLRVLLNGGVNVKAKSNDGLTALDLAERYGFDEVINILKRRDAQKQ